MACGYLMVYRFCVLYCHPLVLQKHPDRIPVICQRKINSTIPRVDKNKYLVPRDITVGQFIYVIRKRISISKDEALFMFTENGIIPPSSTLLSNLYTENKDEDGFLYIIYSGENTFG